MAATPEIPKPQVSQEVTERKEEFIVPEKLQQAVPGMKVVKKNFTAQVKGDNGQSLIQTPPAQVVTVPPPAGQMTLATWAKGPITSSVSWLGMFWIRIIKKALHFGWNVTSGENNTPIS